MLFLFDLLFFKQLLLCTLDFEESATCNSWLLDCCDATSKGDSSDMDKDWDDLLTRVEEDGEEEDDEDEDEDVTTTALDNAFILLPRFCFLSLSSAVAPLISVCTTV